MHPSDVSSPTNSNPSQPRRRKNPTEPPNHDSQNDPPRPQQETQQVASGTQDPDEKLEFDFLADLPRFATVPDGIAESGGFHGDCPDEKKGAVEDEVDKEEEIEKKEMEIGEDVDEEEGEGAEAERKEE